MIRMLSAFDLGFGEDETAFRASYADFMAKLYAADLIVTADPPGRRVSDTPMDTADDDTRQFFSIMYFRDRAQLDKAYAYLESQDDTAMTAAHRGMYRRITNSLFLCWDEGELTPITKDSGKRGDTP